MLKNPDENVKEEKRRRTGAGEKQNCFMHNHSGISAWFLHTANSKQGLGDWRTGGGGRGLYNTYLHCLPPPPSLYLPLLYIYHTTYITPYIYLLYTIHSIFLPFLLYLIITYHCTSFAAVLFAFLHSLPSAFHPPSGDRLGGSGTGLALVENRQCVALKRKSLNL